MQLDNLPLDNLQLALGYKFRNPKFLKQALTHKSYAYENQLSPSASNERLEFLGDAVLELGVSDCLFTLYPNMPEGKLTQSRASLVCESTLATLARDFSLGTYLLLGNGEDQSGGREKPSLLADVFEALLGAVYLDGGAEAARNLVVHLFTPLATNLPQQRDAKSTLQEILQKKSGETAAYNTINQIGPPHERCFVVHVTHQGRILAQGSGRSKKEAEQNAAEAALEKMNF